MIKTEYRLEHQVWTKEWFPSEWDTIRKSYDIVYPTLKEALNRVKDLNDEDLEFGKSLPRRVICRITTEFEVK